MLLKVQLQKQSWPWHVNLNVYWRGKLLRSFFLNGFSMVRLTRQLGDLSRASLFSLGMILMEHSISQWPGSKGLFARRGNFAITIGRVGTDLEAVVITPADLATTVTEQDILALVKERIGD